MIWREWQETAAFLSAGIGKEWDKSGAQARVWFGILEDLPVEAVKAACVAYLAEAEFPGFPPPGAIRKRAVVLLATGGGPQSNLEAWESARKSAKLYCEYDAERSLSAVRGLDPITREVVRNLGGLRAIALSQNLGILRAQFLWAWDQSVKAHASRPLLPGPAEVARITQRQKRIQAANPAALKLAGNFEAG